MRPLFCVCCSGIGRRVAASKIHLHHLYLLNCPCLVIILSCVLLSWNNCSVEVFDANRITCLVCLSSEIWLRSNRVPCRPLVGQCFGFPSTTLCSVFPVLLGQPDYLTWYKSFSILGDYVGFYGFSIYSNLTFGFVAVNVPHFRSLEEIIVLVLPLSTSTIFIDNGVKSSCSFIILHLLQTIN